jgi:hypothetical protein
MSATERRRSREGLSVQTLVIAAVASAAAAIVTSTFWRGGTIVTAAMTPVIVAIVKELLARPLESEVVRRPVSAVRAVAPTTVGARRFERPRDARVPVEAGRARRDAPPGGARGSADPRPPAPTSAVAERPRAADAGPIRTYGRRRRLHLGVAIATGFVAFVVALVVLTVPELIFGGSVAGKGDTTLFGGRTEKTTTAPSQTSTTPTSTSPTKTSPQGQTHTSTAPSQTSPSEQSPPQSQRPPSSQQPPGGKSSPAPSPSSGGTAPPK